MKRIAIFTTSRADFGIFTPLIKEINISKHLKCLIFAGGTHLSSEYGKTISEISSNNFKITSTFNYISNQNNSYSLARSAGICTMELANIFKKYKFDFVCLVGDRYELLSVVINAILFKKPIIHIHGGEKSEGTIDEQIRHMITKSAHIHFTACEEYSLNIRKMGESQWRIFNVGALSIDNIFNTSLTPKTELFKKLKLSKEKDTILLTYHPVALEFKISHEKQIKNIFAALNKFDFQVVVTSSGNETDRDKIMSIIHDEVNKNKNYHYFDSLGVHNYLSILPNCKFIIGNSSSGIIEAPYFKIPTVNIGDRQKGRIQHKSIINSDYSVNSIVSGIKKAISKEFINSIKKMKYEFGNGDAAKKIVKVLSGIEINEKLMRKELDFPS